LPYVARIDSLVFDLLGLHETAVGISDCGCQYLPTRHRRRYSELAAYAPGKRRVAIIVLTLVSFIGRCWVLSRCARADVKGSSYLHVT
jgi:hypothetical protein